jgi:hypothetical protein
MATKKMLLLLSRQLAILFLIVAPFFSMAQDSRANQRIVLIRHAEKPLNGNNLSCSGFNRSLKLVGLLKEKFGIPDYIFVPSPGTGKQTKNLRMLQTALPLATKYNLAINTKYAVNDVNQMAREVSKRRGTILIVWEHNQLPAIARALGVQMSELYWASNDYDSIWIISYNHSKTKLQKDKEGINPLEGCPF